MAGGRPRWAGGSASFGHVNGVHMQNLDSWGPYAEAIADNRLPLSRAYRPSSEERLIRELVLQLKLGSIRQSYFQGKYGLYVRARFTSVWDALTDEGFMAGENGDVIALSREGLLRVDSFLPRFFRPEHTNIRYT